jgi:hypothetical protein
MRIIVYVIIICVYWINVFALSIQCDFEEVYENGEFQQGLILINKENLRYQYFDLSLFTLLYVNKKLFVIENSNLNRAQIIENNEIIPFISDIYKDYPNIKTSYFRNNYEIIIEKSHKDFIKRLIAKSPQLNVSVYFNNCKEEIINKKFFDFNPLIRYVPN